MYTFDIIRIATLNLTLTPNFEQWSEGFSFFVIFLLFFVIFFFASSY